jgi:hypothetical protein
MPLGINKFLENWCSRRHTSRLYLRAYIKLGLILCIFGLILIKRFPSLAVLGVREIRLTLDCMEQSTFFLQAHVSSASQ